MPNRHDDETYAKRLQSAQKLAAILHPTPADYQATACWAGLGVGAMKRWKQELNRGQSPEEVAASTAGRPPKAAVEAAKVRAAVKAVGADSTARDLLNVIRGRRKGGPQAGGPFGRLALCGGLRLRLTAGHSLEAASARRRAEARARRRAEMCARRNRLVFISHSFDFEARFLFLGAGASLVVVDGQHRFNGHYLLDGSLVLNRHDGGIDARLPGSIFELKSR
jgi:hypothetical protein